MSQRHVPAKILLTGGTGFLGQHLTKRLLDEGHSVRLISRTRPVHPERSGAESKGQSASNASVATASPDWVQGDLSDRDAVRRALKDIEVVYHLAGKVSFDPRDGRDMYALHVDCTRELLKDVREAGIKRFVLASTSGTIAVSKTERTGTEADDYPIETVGRWPYYLSKIYEEKLALEFCKKHEIPLVVLNPSLLLGPGDERLSSTWTVMKFLNGEILALPGGGISFVDVRDAAEAFVQALHRGELYGRHLMGVNLSMADFFARLERLSGVRAPKLTLGSKLNVLGAHVLKKLANARGTEPALDPASADIAEHWFWLDASKAERELGFHARDAQETLFDTVHDLLGRMPPGSLPGVKGRLAELRNGAR
jgi:dihydroflavonol-4-reductase